MSGRSMNDPRTLTNTIQQSFPGPGVRTDLILDIGAARDSNGDILGSISNPTMGFSTHMLTANWDAGNADVPAWAWQMPGNFATDGRRMAVVASLLQGGSTDAITMTCTIYARGSDGAEKGPFTVADVEVPAGGTGPADVYFDFTDAEDANGEKIDPNDALTISLTPGTHATDALTLFGLRVRAHLNPALTDKDARSGELA